MFIFYFFIFLNFKPVLVHLYPLKIENNFKNGKEFILFLKDKTQREQKEFLSFLQKHQTHYRNLRAFWIFNGFYIEADSIFIEQLKKHKDVSYIQEDIRVPLCSLKSIKPLIYGAESLAWHLDYLKIRELWQDGFTGEGIIIGVIDTGIDTSNADLSPPFLIFRDVVDYRTIPYDDFGHGTYVCALIAGDKTGVAPWAYLVVIRAFTEEGGFISDIHEAFEYVLEIFLSGIKINILNGSFGAYPLFSEFFEDIWNLQSAGIIPCFAIGNEGPYSSTSASPGNYPHSFGIGSCDSLSQISFFSSRGPAPQIPPWDNSFYWLFPDWNFIKPNITAPGEDIVSIFKNQYIIASGTSASASIFSGVLSLFLSKNPTLTFTQIYELLKNYSFQPEGYLYPNNTFGFGILEPVSVVSAISPYPNFYIQVEKIEILKDASEMYFPGDTASLCFVFKNIGEETDSLFLKIYIENAKGYLKDSLFVFSPFLKYRIDSVKTEIFFSPSIPSGDTLFLNFIFSDALKTQIFQRKIYTGTFHKSYLTTNAPLYLSQSRFGTFGFLTPYQEKGEGARIRDSKNFLYYGSFAFGTSTDYLVDRFYQIYGLWDMDFQPEPFSEGYFKIEEKENYKTFITRYSDWNHQNRKEIYIYENLYQTNSSFPFLLLEFTIENRGSSILDPLYAGLFFDFDIPPGPPFNLVSYDEMRNLIFIYSSDTNTPIAGILPLDNSPVSYINNEDVMYPYFGMTDSMKFYFLKGKEISHQTLDYADYTLFTSKGPFTLSPNSSIKLYFGFVAGFNINELKESADSLNTFYQRIRGIENPLPIIIDPFGISLPFPNPWNPKKTPLKIEFWVKQKQDIELTLFDISGRKRDNIISLKNFYGKKEILLNKIYPQGVYFLTLKGEREWSKKKLVIFIPE